MKSNRTPGDRSRIEGMMHRSMPATLSIREAAPGQSDDGLLRLHISASSELPVTRSGFWDDPWIEVLGHKPGECDLSRFEGGAGVVLANHNRYAAVGNTPLAGIGKVEKAWLESGRTEMDIVISRREALADLRQDIADGLVVNVSLGYQINERTLSKANGDKGPDEYRVTSWMPFEVSLVDIPADATIGLGRAADQTESPATRYRVVDLSPAEGLTQGERSMNQKVETPPAETTKPAASDPAPTAAARGFSSDSLSAERERLREINAMGRQFGMQKEADAAIDNGMSIETFRKQVLDRQVETGKLRPAESSEIGMSERDVGQYSFCRALLAAQDPLQAAKLAPFELECSRAAQDKRGDSRSKERDTAITIPIDVLMRGISIDDKIAHIAARSLIARAQRSSNEALAMYRDLLVGTPTAGGNTVATELLGSSFIDLLRNAMVLDKLGVTWLRDLNGNLAIPSHAGSATGYWVAENGAPTESQQTVGQVTMTPKTVGAFTDYSRRLLLQSSIDVEAFVRADLAAVIGQAIQLGALNGSGASNQPTGLLNTAGIGSVAGGTNGAAPTYDLMVDLESAVANVNGDVGGMAYLTNTKVRGKLRKTQEFASTNGRPVWMTGREKGIGEVLGYDAVTTNTMPSNLTKGTSSGVCSAIAYGNWPDLMIGMWGGLDIMLDPYTGATAGTKRVIALQDVDVAVRRVACFAAMLDALTA